LSYQYRRASFSGQKDTDIKAYIETLVVLDKTVRDQFDSDSEAEKYVEVLLMLVSHSLYRKARASFSINPIFSIIFSITP
jgi:hypothetical protein